MMVSGRYTKKKATYYDIIQPAGSQAGFPVRKRLTWEMADLLVKTDYRNTDFIVARQGSYRKVL